jgi:hypothetical protein
MSEGQGSMSYQSPQTSGGGGGGTVTGAESGVSLVGTDVILGNNAADVGDPGELLWDTRIQMQAFDLLFAMHGVDDGILFNDPNDGNPSNYIPSNWTSNPSGAQYWSVWTPANYTTPYPGFGTAERWYSGYGTYDGVNEPTTSRPNVVAMWWGYNTDYQQGPITAGEAAFRFATESYYVIGVSPSFEFHIPEMTTEGGTISRLDSLYYDRQTAVGFRNLTCDDFNIYSQFFPVPTGMAYFITEYIPGPDVAALSIRSMNPGGISTLSLQNYSTGNGTFTYQDGELFVAAMTRLDLHGEICALDGTVSTNVVSPCVFSNNNTDTPGNDAQLEVSSVPLLGVRLPRMTTAQRNAIPAIVASGGLVVFVTDSLPNGKLSIWTGTSWEIVQSV